MSALPSKADISRLSSHRVCSTSQGKEETAVTATLYRFSIADSAYERKVKWSREIKMPELSLAKRSSRSRKIRQSFFEFSTEQIEAVRRLVGRRIAEVECELIIETLADQRGSPTNAAKLLGISIRTLRNKIHEYDGRGKQCPNQASIE
jgi:DNA-binding NtrC family response regulator